MKQLCRHDKHKVIADIWEPKWSTESILINVDKITPDVEHYIFQFKHDSPKKKYGWFYLSGKVIRRHHKQANGRGEVYVVPLTKREEFQPIKICKHLNETLELK